MLNNDQDSEGRSQIIVEDKLVGRQRPALPLSRRFLPNGDTQRSSHHITSSAHNVKAGPTVDPLVRAEDTLHDNVVRPCASAVQAEGQPSGQNLTQDSVNDLVHTFSTAKGEVPGPLHNAAATRRITRCRPA